MKIRRSSEWLLPALLLTVLSAPAAGQGTDSRWLAFLGCWEATPATAGNPMLCIVPRTADVGVDMVAIANGQVVSRGAVRADGEMQEGSREGCTGWERGRFSQDGTRIYLDAQHMCGTVRQESSGMLAMISGTEWVDVRSVAVDGQPATGVSHYTLAPIDVAEAAGFGNIAADQAMAVRAARTAASSAVTIDDVIDANEFVTADVVRTWVAERNQMFQLDGERLVRMADAGVAPEVIDVVVAVSYPDYFSVGAGAQVDANGVQRGQSGYLDDGYLGSRRYGYFDSMYGYGYGYGYGSYYGSYGGYYGGYGYPGIYQPTVIVVERSSPEQQRQSRVVNGRGYTRSQGSTSTGSTGSSSSGGSSSAPAPAPAAEPSSGEGSGTSTGRTAKPREPGQ